MDTRQMRGLTTAIAIGLSIGLWISFILDTYFDPRQISKQIRMEQVIEFQRTRITAMGERLVRTERQLLICEGDI